MAAGELPSSVVAGIAFVGRGAGQVKSLGGFRKRHHIVPDAANEVTNAFLGKICEAELRTDAEELFQRIRVGLNYKRREVGLNVASPIAVLTARDFLVELAFALDESDPARFVTTTVLSGLKRPALMKTDEFGAIFAGRFAEISFALKRGAKVESVIDAIEGLEETGEMTVSYPSDCRNCTVCVAGVDAQVRFTGAELEVIFPRAGSPAQLASAFAEVSEAFQISPVLSGLIS